MGGAHGMACAPFFFSGPHRGTRAPHRQAHSGPNAPTGVKSDLASGWTIAPSRSKQRYTLVCPRSAVRKPTRSRWWSTRAIAGLSARRSHSPAGRYGSSIAPRRSQAAQTAASARTSVLGRRMYVWLVDARLTPHRTCAASRACRVDDSRRRSFPFAFCPLPAAQRAPVRAPRDAVRRTRWRAMCENDKSTVLEEAFHEAP